MKKLAILVICISALPMLTGSAFAQDDSRAEISAGWRDYHVRLEGAVDPIELQNPNDFPKGWYADVAFNLSPKFAIVGEAGGTYHNDAMTRPSGSVTFDEALEIKFHTFMGGVRVRAPQLEWFVPFGQVVFGGERDTSTSERTLSFQNPPRTPSRTLREADTSNPVLGLDAGVTMAAGPLGGRVSVGYVRFFDRADADALRVNVGVAVRF